jgi:hypothetical protein
MKDDVFDKVQSFLHMERTRGVVAKKANKKTGFAGLWLKVWCTSPRILLTKSRGK